MRVVSLDYENYLRVWNECMQEVYWFEENHFFDYSRIEEQKNLKDQMSNPENIFLVAQSDNREPIGVIGVKVKGKTATIRRWEPIVKIEYRGSGADATLVSEALRRCKKKGIERVTSTLRYPWGSEKPWLGDLFTEHGFKSIKPGIQLIKEMKSSEPPPRTIYENHYDTQYTVEEIQGFILRAFIGTPEDRLIHSDDATVTDPETIHNHLVTQNDGFFGPSPPELRRIVQIDSKPAGFIRCFIRNEEHRPPFGLIGILGVFPEHRRTGIGYNLVWNVLQEFRKHGLDYAYVGTPEINTPAIRLYKKAGFEPLFRILNYEKKLS